MERNDSSIFSFVVTNKFCKILLEEDLMDIVGILLSGSCDWKANALRHSCDSLIGQVKGSLLYLRNICSLNLHFDASHFSTGDIIQFLC